MFSCIGRQGCGKLPGTLFVMAAGLLCAARLAPAGVAEEFRAVRRALTRQVHSRSELECLAALEELRQYPVADAARLAITAIERHQGEAVRQAAQDTLCVLAAHDQPAAYLYKALVRELAGRTPSPAVPSMFVALGSAGSASAAKLHEALEAVYRPATPVAARVLALIDSLVENPDARAIKSLQAAADSGLFDRDFPFRRAVAQALMGRRSHEALAALIELLPRLEGEVRGETLEYLARVTGQPAAISDAEWQAWWQANQSQFTFPAELLTAERPAPAALAPGPRAVRSYYYNLPIYARRVVFIIDTSSSMKGERLVAAQRELIDAVQGLTENVCFSIVAFDTFPRAWQPSLVPATAQAKTAACDFVARQKAGGTTASFDALELAFSFDTEAVYFLTDGAPTGGKISQPARIVQVVTEQNRLRRITINAIGIGVGPEGGPFETFLRTLAEENYGRFRRVDE